MSSWRKVFEGQSHVLSWEGQGEGIPVCQGVGFISYKAVFLPLVDCLALLVGSVLKGKSCCVMRRSGRVRSCRELCYFCPLSCLSLLLTAGFRVSTGNLCTDPFFKAIPVTV